MDVFLYSGMLSRSQDLRFIELVSKNKNSDQVLLVLATLGGDAHAAYKIARYLQTLYGSYKVCIAGLCKSAGTVIAVGAEELVFSPYGELGPLDVQLTKSDDLAGQVSGLNIDEALTTLEVRATKLFHTLIQDITGASSGIVSFHTASHSASEIVGALYAQIFAKIDPEETGSRQRAMRIGVDYCRRLNNNSNNMEERSIDLLARRTYPDHSFVIDLTEAQSLFKNVREVNPQEKSMIENLGNACRIPSLGPTTIKNITYLYQRDTTEDKHEKPRKAKAERRRDKPKAKEGKSLNGENPA